MVVAFSVSHLPSATVTFWSVFLPYWTHSALSHADRSLSHIRKLNRRQVDRLPFGKFAFNQQKPEQSNFAFDWLSSELAMSHRELSSCKMTDAVVSPFLVSCGSLRWRQRSTFGYFFCCFSQQPFHLLSPWSLPNFIALISRFDEVSDYHRAAEVSPSRISWIFRWQIWMINSFELMFINHF